ncbi:N-acetyltransferase [Hahella sp. CCB-MM4]|uniref:GNAT family N-acetyltransferase n=1 Tax=Hahella sp. (strain CCB-MM4) TaxID=1926491 RepID=UPI000B9C2CF9|nr:GNAT family N-acetyltransferase [Hahella sp. CCB-MM4]
MKIEAANKEDAGELAYLINLAGEGFPELLWSGMVEGSETPLQVGAKRAAREEGGFSYTNAKVIRIEEDIAGMVISYKLDDPYDIGDLADYPEPVRSLIQLEAKVPGSWYINAIATHENYRGRGIATKLMADAEMQAREHGANTMSLIVSSENRLARSLYLNMEYRIVSSLPVASHLSFIHGGIWELMVKPVPNE